jgi:hypothetical protein
MRRWKYAVTFEQPLTRPPETVRGMVEAEQPQSAVSKAVREAKKARRSQRFDSLVVLIEREDA